MAEWLTRLSTKQLCFACVGSNPAVVVIFNKYKPIKSNLYICHDYIQQLRFLFYKYL